MSRSRWLARLSTTGVGLRFDMVSLMGLYQSNIDFLRIDFQLGTTATREFFDDRTIPAVFLETW